MKISPVLNNFNFSKNIISNTTVKTTDGRGARVNFVEYDPKSLDDQRQITRINSLWQPDSGYMEVISRFFREAVKHKNREYKRIHESWHFYGLEDKNGETLAIAHAQERNTCPHYRIGNEEALEINFIETRPDEAFYSKTRQYEGLGEALVSKIVQEADKKDKDSILLESANEYFWMKSGYFSQCGIRGDMPLRRLSKEDFSGYVKYVEAKNIKSETLCS